MLACPARPAMGVATSISSENNDTDRRFPGSDDVATSGADEGTIATHFGNAAVVNASHPINELRDRNGGEYLGTRWVLLTGYVRGRALLQRGNIRLTEVEPVA